MCPPPEVGTLGLALVEAEIYVTSGPSAPSGNTTACLVATIPQGTTDIDQSLL